MGHYSIGLDQSIDFFLGVVLAEAHDDVSLRESVIEADGAEDVGDFE